MTVDIGTLRLIAPIVTGVGQCIADALALTPAGAPGRVCLLIPGQLIPHDNCDCDGGGQLAQVIRNVYGANTFPTPLAGSWLKCAPHSVVIQVVAGVNRCTPGMIDGINGTMPVPPTCDELLAAAVQEDWDRQAVRAAIACCLGDLTSPQTRPRVVTDWSLGDTVTLLDQGQCSGTETTYLLGVKPCSC